MKNQILITLLLFASWPSIGWTQVSEEVNDLNPNKKAVVIHADLFTGGSLMSLNIEQLFFVQPNVAIATNIGLGFARENDVCLGGCETSPASYITIPHQFTFNAGNGRHFLEFGLTGTFVSEVANNYKVYPMIGYRMHPLEYGILTFRAFVQFPVKGLGDSETIFIPIGLSFGAVF